MNTKTTPIENYSNAGLTQISCTATKGAQVDNPMPVGDVQPESPIVAVNAVTLNTDNTVSFNFNVDIDAAYTGTPTLWVNTETKEFYVEYNYTEEWAPKLTNWQIQATYDNTNARGGHVLAAGDQITLYNRDVDPVTSRGTKTTVQPPTT
ncbi:hypothetical protein ACFO3O_04590 [Dokdonia ponticola]|uniref:CBM20 domain-containing protein n=1 Tax=Dokdonia ponticola TaxID=2041041 RepID=A0ABV9HVW3_9FLAO